MNLSAVFLDHVGPAAAAALRADSARVEELERSLEELWSVARAAWPDLNVPVESFMAAVARGLAEGNAEEEPLAAVRATCAADLYLACACARGDAAALAAFDAHHVAQLSMRAARGEGDFVAEVRQLVRSWLLVSTNGQRPRIARYAGRAPLAVWVRIAAARIALNLRRDSDKPDRPGADPEAFTPALPDPELDHLRVRYAGDFHGAFEAALAKLAPRDGTIIRLYYLEGVGPEEIGALYGASKRTAQRWIADIRNAILEAVRGALAQRLNLSGSQVDSLMVLLYRDLDTSIARLLPRENGDRKDDETG